MDFNNANARKLELQTSMISLGPASTSFAPRPCSLSFCVLNFEIPGTPREARKKLSPLLVQRAFKQ